MSESVLPTLRELRHEYEVLPPTAIRWKTDAGVTFLQRLDLASSTYSVAQLAVALGITRQSISRMLWRNHPRTFEPWPTREETAEFRGLWEDAERLFRSRQRVKQDSTLYESLHLAFMELRKKYSIPILAHAVNVPSERLRRYEKPPLLSLSELVERRKLIYLLEAMPTGERWSPDFYRAIEHAASIMSVRKLAEALDMSVNEITEILDDAHRLSG